VNGNTIQKNDNGTVQNFLYNEDDRLTEVKDATGALVARYYYDPFGRRLWKEVGGTRTYFIYADEGLIAEFDGAGSQTKAYGFAPNSTWTTDPLFMKQGGEYYFYHNDHLGTPQTMSSGSGAVVWSAKYESFGKAEIDPASIVENNLRFPGQYYDKETGLHYNYHRHYDPRYGRYVAPDPSNSVQATESGIPYLLPLRVVTPWELHPFHYVGSNTINWTDPTGLRYQPTTTLALEKAILTGNSAEVETIAYAMGLSIPPAVLAAIAANEIKCPHLAKDIIDELNDGTPVPDIIDKIKEQNRKKLAQTKCEEQQKIEPSRWQKHEQRDPGPESCIRCFTKAGRWYEKPWACLTCFYHVFFGGVGGG
jgi:RHS repeat-associated protein